MVKEYGMFINGEWIEGESGTFIEVENPATREIIAKVSRGNEADCNKAVAAAKRAFPAWAAVSPTERANLIRRVGKILSAKRDEIAAIITAELGMPIRYSAAYHVDGPINECGVFADFAENFEYEKKQAGGYILREPVGVVAGLTPWNYPLDQITLKLLSAVAAGNTVVLKPSQLAPLSALAFAEVFVEAGAPAGVFNVVTGAGGEVGNILAVHPDVSMISFTGSTAAGKEVGKLAVGSNVKKIALELGGKSAMIVLEDGDISAAVDKVLSSSFMNSGQTCCAYTRLLIPASRKDEIEAMIVEKAGKFVVGNPTDPGTDIGPVISAKAYEKIRSYIRLGIEEGARMLVGEIPQDAGDGYYIHPVVFTDVKNNMRIAQEEIFGPVLVVITYATEEEAVEIANDSPYGLDGAVFGAPKHAYQIAKQLKTGDVHINAAPFYPTFPFGGYKESGLGREGSIYGFEEYLEIKSVYITD